MTDANTGVNKGDEEEEESVGGAGQQEENDVVPVHKTDKNRMVDLHGDLPTSAERILRPSSEMIMMMPWRMVRP